jgi:dTDP-glucose pyrophosphorylase
VGGKPMIAWVIDNVRPQRHHTFTFICLQEHLERYPEVPETLRELAPDCHIVPVREVTEGAACTVLLARDIIDSEAPLMIANSDQFVDLDIEDYLAAGDVPGVDGLIMTFWSEDPKWSFCGMREDGTVERVVEKEVISNEATVGIYNFSRGADFVRAADAMIARDLRVKGEFYVAPVYNILIDQGARVVVKATGKEGAGMYGLGIPEDLAYFQGTDTYRQQAPQP